MHWNVPGNGSNTLTVTDGAGDLSTSGCYTDEHLSIITMQQHALTRKAVFIIIMVFGLHSAVVAQEMEKPEKFLGRWSLYLPDGAGYLKVHGKQGFIDAELLWYGGSIYPVAGLYFTDESLVVTRISGQVRKQDASGKPLRTHQLTHQFIFSMLSDDELAGKAVLVNENGMGVRITEFTARKIPPLPPAPDLSAIRYGKPVILFNGEDLNQWTLTDPADRYPFQVVGGAMVNEPVQGEGKLGKFRTVDEFEDFKLNLELNLPVETNSGIYLRGIYEIQVKSTYGKPLNSHCMGALYGRIVPSVPAEKPLGQWQDLEIILCRRHVTVVLNGVTIIDNQPVEGVTGGALSANEFVPGPIYLQGNHGRGVKYRNIVLTPILN